MKKILICLWVILAISCWGQVHATTMIAPDAPHAAYNFYPFDGNFVPGRYQQVYDSSQFAGPIEIQSLAFSPNFSGNYGADLEIRFVQTSVAVGDLTTTLDDNFTGALTTVFSDSSFTQAVTGGSETFSLVFDFSSTPFIYDPSGGENLLLDIVINSYSWDVGGLFGVSRADETGLSSRAWNSTNQGNNTDLVALRTQFTFEAAVPEPATLLLIGTGLVGLVGFRRRFRN